MLLAVTGLYAFLLGLVFVVLFAHVGMTRTNAGVSLGDGGKPELIEAIRRHTNFIENVPLALVLMAIVEANGAPKWWLHVLGIALLAGRIAHPFGLNVARMNEPARIAGAGATALTLVALIATAGWEALRA